MSVVTERKLSSRAVIGRYYLELAKAGDLGWVDEISNLFRSDQDEEEYAWLGQSPILREWIGGRHAVELGESSFKIPNTHYEATLQVKLRDLMRDKSPQTMIRVAELARGSRTHWSKLIANLVLAGASSVCYDGQYFFDTDHSEGDSGTQSNDITVDISDLPVETPGSPTNPSVAALQLAIARGVAQIASLKNDRGEPMNEDASRFLVLTGTNFMQQAQTAIATPMQVAETQTALQGVRQAGTQITTGSSARFDADWTDTLAVFRTDTSIKPLIRQEETPMRMKAKAEGSDFEFDNDAHQYGVDSWRGVGYGMWQFACLVKLV